MRRSGAMEDRYGKMEIACMQNIKQLDFAVPKIGAGNLFYGDVHTSVYQRDAQSAILVHAQRLYGVPSSQRCR